MERLEVLQALEESVRQSESGKLKDARPAIRRLVDELRSSKRQDNRGNQDLKQRRSKN